MLNCMIDENETQRQISPTIIFENLTAAVRLGEQMLNESSTVEEFNEKLKASRCVPVHNVNSGWREQEFGKAKEQEKQKAEAERKRAMAMANLCGLLRGRPKQAEAIDGEFEEINASRDASITRTEAAEKAGVSEANFLHAGNLEQAPSIREALRLPRHAHGCTKQWPRVIQGWCAVQNILKLFQLVVVQFLDPAAESCRR